MNVSELKNLKLIKVFYKIIILLLIFVTIFSYIPIKSVIAVSNAESNGAVRTTNVVVEKAIECHKYVREHGYTYGGGLYIPDDIMTSNIIDCSAYVSWVLYEIGCESFHTYQETEFVANCSAGAHPELEEITDKSQVQPGDILVYRAYGSYSSGHVELAAQVENGEVIRVYNCGSNNAISSEGTPEYPETSFPSRDITEYSENKIYRVKNISQQTVSSNLDDDGKMPALVPYLVNSVISKYAQTSVNGGQSGSSASTGGRITNYEESGDGWLSVTEVKYPNGTVRKYRNYQQGIASFCSYWDKPYWDGNCASDACGPASIAIVLSGYGYDVNPGGVVDIMHEQFGTDSSDSFENLRQPLKYVSGIEAEDHDATSSPEAVQIIRESFNNARPVVVNAPGHYIVLLGEDENGKLIVSDPATKFYASKGYEDLGPWAGQGPDTLEEFVSQGFIDCGYILITSDGGTTNNTITPSTNNNNNSNNNNIQGTGEANVEICNAESGGYDAIFTSGTTGRQFKEYRQNLDGWEAKYPITHLPEVRESGWRSECGTVSVITLGSGYSQNATFEDATKKLTEFNGSSQLVSWTKEYTGQDINWETTYSKEDIANKLASGCVALLHSTSELVSSSGSHYMTILDINKEKTEVYLSNPWQGSDYQGWITFDKLSNIFESIAFVTNDGSIVNYSSGGQTANQTGSNQQFSGPPMVNNIIENDHNGYKLNIDLNSEVDRIIRKLKERNFELKDYLSEPKQREYLKNILKACIVVQYPDLRNAEEIAKKQHTDELQGCIRVKRYVDSDTLSFSDGLSNVKDDEDDGIYLSYIPYNKLNELINNSDKSALNYFSLDRNNNIVFAGWQSLDTGVSIRQIGGETDPDPDSEPAPRTQPYSKLVQKSAGYLNQIKNYSVPFNLFWTLLVYSDDEKFINDFANLVINTDIVIGCFDATTTKITTYKNEYDKHVRTEDNVYINNQNVGDPTTDSENIYKYQVVEKQILKTDNAPLKIKHADTWTAVYNMSYELVNKTTTSNEEIELDIETTDRDFNQINNDSDIDKILEENENVRKKVEDEKNRLKNEVHNYNNENFRNRYDIINDAIDNIYRFSGKYAELLKIEDIQNYVIDFIIDENSSDYIKKVFNENDVIKDYAKEIGASDDRSQAAEAVITMVNQARNNTSSQGSLWNRLTNNGSDTRKNKKLEYDITAIVLAEYKTKENQTENVDIETITPQIEEKTSKNGNVRFKTDPYAKENSFVKLLYYSKYARDNLELITDWFFDSLKNTSMISDLEDLIKYLFQCIYNTDYGITEEKIKELKDFFDPEKMSAGMNSVSGTSTLQSADAEGIYNYLVGHGYTNAGAAGVMGNMEVESGLRPECVQGCYLYDNPDEYNREYTRKVDSKEISKDEFINNGPNGNGYGLVQFTDESLKQDLYENTVEKGRSIADMEGQLECVIKVVKENHPNLHNTLTTSNDLYTCTYEFLYEYERPAYPDADERYGYAQKYFK